MIRHELAHIRWHDQILKPLYFMVLSFYWYNPFVWAAFFLFSTDIELACDEAVAGMYDEDQRKQYVQALLSVAGNGRGMGLLTLPFGKAPVAERKHDALAQDYAGRFAAIIPEPDIGYIYADYEVKGLGGRAENGFWFLQTGTLMYIDLDSPPRFGWRLGLSNDEYTRLERQLSVNGTLTFDASDFKAWKPLLDELHIEYDFTPDPESARYQGAVAWLERVIGESWKDGMSKEQAPKEDRLKGTWTLGQYERIYNRYFADTVRASDPGWQAGDDFDKAVIEAVEREEIEKYISSDGTELSLSEYASIKNGSYGKLVKSYYRKEENEKAASVSTEANANLSSVRAGADSLKKAADAYNSVVTSSGNSDSRDVLLNAGWMVGNTEKAAGLLSKVGIEVGSDNKLTVNEDKLKEANIGSLKLLFTGHNSSADKVSSKAAGISRAAAKSAGATYTKNGTWSSALDSIVGSAVSKATGKSEKSDKDGKSSRSKRSTARKEDGNTKSS